jgi:hypothetical protein
MPTKATAPSVESLAPSNENSVLDFALLIIAITPPTIDEHASPKVTTMGIEFQKAMKANHPLAMEYVARLMRQTMRHNGPLYKDRSTLSRSFVEKNSPFTRGFRMKRSQSSKHSSGQGELLAAKQQGHRQE